MKKWSEFEKEKRKRTDVWLNDMNYASNSAATVNRECDWPTLGYNVPSQLAKLNIPLEPESTYIPPKYPPGN
ncbi:hypothetical protein K7432_007211 [Basidiobolus ranarum]|uniref:RagB/SusD family nutrient uptake outer membrane protein n=1 Tax=Basidiobolus ranarum TaxID=34480 RepID=A0ABR2W1D5_9FUNG